MAKKISGSEIVIECLKEQGVDIVFGCKKEGKEYYDISKK